MRFAYLNCETINFMDLYLIYLPKIKPGGEQGESPFNMEFSIVSQHRQVSFNINAMRNKKQSFNRPNTRSLKIDTKIKVNRWSQTTVPVIRLSGVWLDRLGFCPEQRITVTTMDKLLIIQLEQND